VHRQAGLAAEGARVTLVSGPVALKAPDGVTFVSVETARDMLKACEEALPADVFVSVAAVADWRPVKAAPKKLKLKGQGEAPSIQLTENPDILRTLSQKRKGRPRLVIGFAAETHDVEQLAVEKRARKGCDFVGPRTRRVDDVGGFESARFRGDAPGRSGASENWL
jgi:phosphopantothenoylcysteine decarboxylase/phosphopantothenate--cysteine ligase